MRSNEDIAEIVAELRAIGTDVHDVEVKAAVGGLPKSMAETLSAFANGSGGTVILGLSEEDGFTPAKGFKPKPIVDALAGACADQLTPPLRPDIDIIPFEGAKVVVANIAELPPFDKPCHVHARGMYRGSFIRTGDGDRLLSAYEIDRLLEERSQPMHDLELVEDATLTDLDAKLFAAVIERQRNLHPRVFASASDEDIALALNIARRSDNGELRLTLAGLVALGTFPQHFFPRLTVTFAAFPGVGKASVPGVKFLDSQSMAGSIPVVIEDTVAAVRRNSRTGGRLEGAFRVDVPDYPADVVRELVCNALMHRDYSSLGRGSQVQVNLYADRLEVLSPGGLFGAVTVETIGEVGTSSTRNQHLAALLETTPYRQGYVSENRGTGFALACRELAAAGMAAPVLVDRPSLFSVTVRRNESLDGFGRSVPAQSTARPKLAVAGDPVLAFIAEHDSVRASDIARETGMPRSTVSYRLRKLLDAGHIEVVGSSEPTSPLRSYRIAN